MRSQSKHSLRRVFENKNNIALIMYARIRQRGHISKTLFVLFFHHGKLFHKVYAFAYQFAKTKVVIDIKPVCF